MVAESSKEIRFAADRMLGRLVRWLRLIGQDVTYWPHLSGSGLIRAARIESRMILTRDRGIRKTRNPPPYLFIESDHFREQLKQVIQTFSLDPFAKIFNRCVQCNSPLESIPTERVKDQVPPYVFTTQEKFSFCQKCQHTYWPATHLQKMLEELRAMGFKSPGK